MDEFTLRVSWEPPFSAADFPIMNYSVRVIAAINSSAEEVFTRQLPPDTLSVTILHSDAISCTNLTFSVTAVNGVGTSLPGITYGAFPDSELFKYHY